MLLDSRVDYLRSLSLRRMLDRQGIPNTIYPNIQESFHMEAMVDILTMVILSILMATMVITITLLFLQKSILPPLLLETLMLINHQLNLMFLRHLLLKVKFQSFTIILKVLCLPSLIHTSLEMVFNNQQGNPKHKGNI